MAPNTLDRTDTAVSINTAAVDFFSKAFDVVNWVNTTSAYVTATRDTGTGGNSFPDGTADYVALTGGSRGGSTTADFSAGLTAISPLRVDQFVPLISEDRTYVDTSVSPSITYNAEFWNNGVVGTVGGIPAAADAHAAYTSSTAGKNERQCWLGADIEGATLAEGRDNFVSFTTGLNSPHTCVFGQTVDLVNATTGNIETYQPWAAAVIASAMRCGSDIAEPLTFKFMRLQGLGQPFDALEHTQDVILGGGCAIQNVPGKGYRIVKCITTYTRLDNDALTEESLVSSWKLIAYDVRTNVEDIYTGTRGLPANVTNMKLTAGDIFNKYVNVALTASTANGATQPPWIINSLTLTRDVADMQATLCLVGGINFELQTLFLVPATITV
jgi:hypothetical protein